MEILKRRQNLCIMAGKGYVSNDLVVEAELSAIVVNEKDYQA
jgi:hypothetical protein